MKRLKMSISQSTRKCTSIILSLVMVISLFSFSMITTNATSDTASKTVKVNDATKATDVDGLVTNKTAKDNGDGTFTLNLEAYATGKVTTGTTVPTDFVLVLDQSGSMTDKITTNERLEITQKWNENNFNANSTGDSSLYYLVDGEYCLVSLKTAVEGNWSVVQYLEYKKNGKKYMFGEKVKSYDDSGTMYDGTLLKVTVKISKQNALKNAVESFMNSVQQDAQKNNVDHRMAMVGFASTTSVGQSNNKNTNLLSTENVVGYSNIKKNDYKSSLVSVNTNGSVNERLTTAKNRIQADGSTDTSAGMDMAENILSATNDDTNRNKVVIMFTDGHPGYGPSSWYQGVADNTIKYSQNCKKNYGATVYTIGVFTEDDKKDTVVNNFMDFVSSNYPNASGMGKYGKDKRGSGTPGEKEYDKYYKLADDENALLGVFGDIAADSAAPSVDLNATAILQDVLTDEFVLADAADKSITVYTAPHTGNFEFGDATEFKDAKIAVDGKKIQVTNFDYATNFCVTKTGDIATSGKKLIVEIKVKRNQTTYGGNAIPTNTIASAIYDGDKKNAVETFPIPTVNLGIRYDIVTKDKSIYLGESVNVNELIELPTDNINCVPDGINNRNVNITYKLLDNGIIVAKKEVSAGMSLKGDLFAGELNNLDNKVLNWSVSVTSVNEESKVNKPAGSRVIGKISNVYVFTPVIQASDQTIFYGETAEPLASGLSVEDWVCKGNMDAPKPTSEEPNVSYELKQVNGESIPNNLSLDDTLDVKIEKVKLNGKVVDSQYVEIKKDNSCQVKEHDKDGDFTIHVVKGQIEINKNITAQYSNESKINSYQTFVYKIERSDEVGGDVVETFYQTLSFDATKTDKDAKAIISNLKKGYYTVTEETTWSKKYTLSTTTDNYKHVNGGEGAGKDLPIGTFDKITGYYGLDEKCYQEKGFKGNKAQVNFKNDLKSWAGWYSDAAGSKNTFNK